MAVTREKVATCDPIWSALREQAEAMAQREPALASFVHATVLKHERLENALSYHLAKKIGGEDLSPMMMREIFDEAMAANPSIGEAVRADLSAVFERDPACQTHVDAFLFYKGFHALREPPCRALAMDERTPVHGAVLPEPYVGTLRVDIHPAASWARAS